MASWELMDKSELGSGIGSYAAIGDSFTEGLHDPGPDGGYLGWADRVAAALAAQRPGFRYANLAIRGKLLDQVIAEQVPPAVEMAPDLVSLAAGGNDILSGADVDVLAAHFEAAVAKLQAAGCRVLIFTGFDPRMFPVIRLLRGRIAAYNMHLRGDRGRGRLRPGRPVVHAGPERPAGLEPGPAAPQPRKATGGWPCGPARSWASRLRRTGGCRCRLAPDRPDGARWLAARRQDARWAREYAMPWVRRRLTGTSSGDGLPPKRPDLLPLSPANEVGQDLF